MKTAIIYDNSGYRYMQMEGPYRTPDGEIHYLEIEIPEGKILKGIDTSVTPNIPIFEDLPKTELQLAQEQILATQSLVADLQEQILSK